MPLKSYLAYPTRGRLEPLEQALAQIPHCDVIPARNRDVVILLTDTPDAAAEQQLEVRLQGIADLDCLALVAGATPEDELIQIGGQAS